MQITSFGAAETVTGSKHVLEANGKRILFDCGMFQGSRKESDHRNRVLPFEPKLFDAVVVTHAHIDHIGLLPMLTKHGYTGPIFCTPATRDLAAIMLLDSAHIQARDAEYLSRKHRSFVAPLYDDHDVYAVMQKIVALPYNMPMEIAGGIRITFREAGHVLGAAMVMVECKEHGKTKRFLEGGDLGRRHMPILRDPWEPEDADVVMMESTYGNRDHDPIESMDEKLAQIIKKTAARGGKIIIPSFALERAQEIIYALHRLETNGDLPRLPVFVDSPMTVNITEVFRLHSESFDDEIRWFMSQEGDPFILENIRYIRRVEESMKLNDLREPAIIISASGMCESGRILHHLRNNCHDDRNTILIVGFQAKNTLGRRIVEREKEIKIFGVKRPLNAEVHVLNGFSAHAGRTELIEFGARFKKCAEHVLLVHGEEEAMGALKTALEEKGQTNVRIQKEGVPLEF
ncbi:MAG TPA: MBL fold metallo-hydrolase [Candidatus Hydrogenedentes bacterium]|nr:MBL fold metallo-hydrolase [Candidatus Hydrogenedentota bacterium]